MLFENIDKLIVETAKSHDKKRLEVLRLIKSELLKFTKSGNGDLTEEKEQKILRKMLDQRNDSIEQYTKANRTDLIEQEDLEKTIIEEFVPKETPEDEIINYTKAIICSMENVSMKDTKKIMEKVSEKCNSSKLGKIVSQVIKENL